uniref:Ion transport domain-containing protein n=1 Tax=Noctiluca scintillans TaxID=2966 RepID=A0A7S1A8C0_NOCSC|mmetsp:Transcript_34828/g.93006  ORF Transcript_34828/g.93006 Transcript_34828/m.93006 type:complete len:179 (+) Transcript_34828:78-614(+)
MTGVSNETTPLFADTNSLPLNDRMRHVIQQHRLRRAYVAFCIGMTLYCFILIVCSGLAHYQKFGFDPHTPWLILGEAVVTIFICTETLADMILCGFRLYWSDWWHRFDVCVSVICLAGLALDFIKSSRNMKLDDYVSMSLLVARYLIQLARIFRVVRSAQIAKARRDAVDDTPIVLPC